ncbi:MAG: LysR family transcriptional regulator [Halocynthiibacter sp.]
MDRINLNRLEYFVTIAEAGTITAAAERLRISKAVVSKQLQLLEAELGATLIIRNSRHLKLTETGERFFQSARAAIQQAEAACQIVQQGHDTPSGTLRITAPLDLGKDYVSPAIAAFRQAYPAVTVDLTISDQKLDPVDARFDIAYRAGWLEDSGNIARKLAEFQQYIVAAPALLALHSTPTTPNSLHDLPFIEHRALANPCDWTLVRSGGSTTKVSLKASISADVTPVIKNIAVSGAGFAILPDFYVLDEIREGSLIRLLPDWDLPRGGVYSVFPPAPYRSAATKAFAEMFRQMLQAKLAEFRQQ